MITSGTTAIVISVISSAVGLFLIGAAITLFTGKSVCFSGFRQVLFGLIAAAITFGIRKIDWCFFSGIRLSTRCMLNVLPNPCFAHDSNS